MNNSQHIIDSRDVIKRIDELQSDMEAFEGSEPADSGVSWASVHPEEVEELEQLVELADQCSDYSDWENGAMLIRDSYFKVYAQELAEEIGAVPTNMRWPYTCIDWEKATGELKLDYTSVEFGSVTYWVR